MTHDDQDAVRAHFNRRFVFGLHAAISLIISTVLFLLVFTHPLNVVIFDGQELWTGYPRPDLKYIASVLVGIVGAHGSWLLWREGKLNRRTMFFPLHIVSTLICLALEFTFFNSWYFNEAYKRVGLYAPASPVISSALILIMLSMTALLTIMLPLHAIWLLYQKMLACSLQRADDMKVKRKREETADDMETTQAHEEQLASIVGDDGELMEWAVREIKAKRPA